MKTRLLKKLRNEAYWKLGVFKFSDGKYRIIYDKTLWNDVSEFNEKHWKMWGNEYQYHVFNDENEVFDNFDTAKSLCDRYRRNYILGEVRKMKFNNKKRYY